MWEGDCGCVPVVDQDGRVVGMLTDRDVCMAAYTQGKPLTDVRVESAMAKQVHSCRPDDAVATAERTMRERQVRRLPVIDAKGRLVGLLSLNDIAIEAVRERELRQREVSAAEVGLTLAALCAHRAPRPGLVAAA
jgi:CBS domain-containing protein